VRFSRDFIKLRRLTFLDADCVLGALTEAGAETITVDLTDQARLAVNDPEGAFGARRNAESTAITLFLVNLDDFPFHLSYH
jgi:hypothetical protein